MSPLESDTLMPYPYPMLSQDKPYALFGACLGAIVAYELARAVEAEALAPPPALLAVAAVSPPHLYALAVARLYLPPGGPAEVDPAALKEGVLAKLAGWESLPRETIMMVRRAWACVQAGTAGLQGRVKLPRPCVGQGRA